jgi:hypothetical protein
MNKKFFIIGLTVLLGVSLFLTGCPTDADGDDSPGGNWYDALGSTGFTVDGTTNTVTVTGDVTLTGDLSIPANGRLQIATDGRLTVPDGVLLVVGSGGSLSADADGVTVTAAGALVVAGTATVGSHTLTPGTYADITDVSGGAPPNLTDALATALTDGAPNVSGNTYTLTENVSISSAVMVPFGVTVVVPTEKTLTVDNDTLTVNGTLTANGTLTVESVLAGTSGTLNGSGHVILAGSDGAEQTTVTIEPTTGIFTFSGTQTAAFGANSTLSLANAIANAVDDNRIVILGNIGNNTADNGFHLYSIVEKAVTVTQADAKPYTIYGSIYVYGDNTKAVTLSNLKIETLKIAYDGYNTAPLKQEKPFLASIGGVTDSLTITDCNLHVSSTMNSLLGGGSANGGPIYNGIRIIPLTTSFSYVFSNNTIEGLKSTYLTTGLTIGSAGSDVGGNWNDRYPAIKDNTTTYNKNTIKVLDLTTNNLYTNFFPTIETWGNTITGFDNEVIFRNDQKSSGNAVKVYNSNSDCYSDEGLASALDWGVSTEVYLATIAAVEGNLEINAQTKLIIEDGAALTIDGNLTAGNGAKIQLGAGSSITFTDSTSTVLNDGEGNYTSNGSTWAKDD